MSLGIPRIPPKAVLDRITAELDQSRPAGRASTAKSSWHFLAGVLPLHMKGQKNGTCSSLHKPPPVEVSASNPRTFRISPGPGQHGYSVTGGASRVQFDCTRVSQKIPAILVRL